MITKSFIFLDRIGKQKEQSIWKQGINSWTDFLNTEDMRGISRRSKIYYDSEIRRAQKELYRHNISYFKDKLPSTETWRLYEMFKDDAVYLDIETSGVSRYDDITVFGLYDGLNTKIMIRGVNLYLRSLKQELNRYKLIITFNGSRFDMPFIMKRYPWLIPKHAMHIDLAPLCASIGLNGGLKEVEKKLGVSRNPIIEKMYGGDALRLWKMYRASGDDYYLKLLVEYNEDDCYNLKKIAEHVIKKLKEKINQTCQEAPRTQTSPSHQAHQGLQGSSSSLQS